MSAAPAKIPAVYFLNITIDQATADKLQEYMQSNREKQRISEDNTLDNKKGQHMDRWSEMLTAGIITQEEYDAIIESQLQEPADRS